MRRLAGKSIASVLYSEIDYADDRFHFFDNPRYDSIDFGAQLNFAKGRPLFVTWGSEFHQYGVSLRDPFLDQSQTRQRILDVSMTKRWAKVIEIPIESADVFWSWSEEAGRPDSRVYYPQDVLLRFANAALIVVSALEIREMDWHMGMMDNITIFDEIAIAKHFGCLDEA